MRRKLVLWVLLLAALPLLYVVGMIVYALVTDYRPVGVATVAVEGQGSGELLGDTVSLVTWNIGYCGLGAEADFFFDGGRMVRPSRGLSDVYYGGVLAMVGGFGADVVLLQEVDRGSKRSYFRDQYAALGEILPGYARAYGKNYDVGFVPIPLLHPMGRVEAGVATYSRYGALGAERYSFSGQDQPNFPNYLFFLDRCYLLMRIPLGGIGRGGRELVVVNTHNSAYDDGRVKALQMEELRGTLLSEYGKGNYVVVGGDWNQYPPNYKGIGGRFGPGLGTPASFFAPAGYPGVGWRWAYDSVRATNRSLRAAFDADTTERKIIDYFLVSPNVEVLGVKGMELNFAYSDHEPVGLRVRLR